MTPHTAEFLKVNMEKDPNAIKGGKKEGTEERVKEGGRKEEFLCAHLEEEVSEYIAWTSSSPSHLYKSSDHQ